MRRRPFILLFLCASIAALSGAAHADDDHVGLFKNVSGSIKVVRKDGTVDAVPGMTLFIADRLVCAPGASGGVVFKDGTLLTVGPASDLLVRDYVFVPNEAKYAFSVYLAKGTAIYSSGKIGKLSPESVKVDTPSATVGVRGTRFLVDAQ